MVSIGDKTMFVVGSSSGVWAVCPNEINLTDLTTILLLVASCIRIQESRHYIIISEATIERARSSQQFSMPQRSYEICKFEISLLYRSCAVPRTSLLVFLGNLRSYAIDG